MNEKLGISKKLNLPFEEAVERTKEVFKSNGFGSVTEINVKKILKEKLDYDFKKYIILGMCNPKIALESLNASDDIGLLLPCNVCIYENKNGETIVNAVNPETLLGITGIDGLEENAAIIKGLIQKAVDEL